LYLSSQQTKLDTTCKCILMLASIFLQHTLAGTSSSGNNPYDLVISLLCLGILTGMVYLFKFILEKCGIARRRNLLSATDLHTAENKNP
jgi:hypothetical protein